MTQLIEKIISTIKEVFPTKQSLLDWKVKCYHSSVFCLSCKHNKKDTVVIVPLPPCKTKKIEGLVVPKRYEEERKLEEQSSIINNFQIGIKPYYYKDTISSFVIYAPYGNIVLSEDCHVVHESNIYMELIDEKLYEMIYG